MISLEAPPTSWLDKFHGSEAQALYCGQVRVKGGPAEHGRASGIARSDDGALAVELRLPTELGGPGGGTNPEQLLAAAYAACFHGALSLLAARAGIPVKDVAVDASVTFARDPMDGLFLLSADTHVSLPGLDRALAAELVRHTERVCPYAKMFRQGIDHLVSVCLDSAPDQDRNNPMEPAHQSLVSHTGHAQVRRGRHPSRIRHAIRDGCGSVPDGR